MGVSLRSDGADLPNQPDGSWIMLADFRLGVHDAVPAAIDPEPILRGVKAQGYYIWPAKRMQPLGTSQ
jgi:hypothetical protein